jgi:hypothetical protein
MRHARRVWPSGFGFPALAVVLLSVQPAMAHRPIFTEDRATGPDTAIQIKEPGISQVVYREITSESPQVWLSFDVPENYKLFVQIGVPVIERLKEFRPAMAIVGPGLPDKDPPFNLPKDSGFKLLATKDVAKPRFFHEHFTGTDSWILRGETVVLPKAGRYYLVGFSPEKQTGKLWLSVGKKESFSFQDLMDFPSWTKKIRKFHEMQDTKPSAPPPTRKKSQAE